MLLLSNHNKKILKPISNKQKKIKTNPPLPSTGKTNTVMIIEDKVSVYQGDAQLFLGTYDLTLRILNLIDKENVVINLESK